VTYFTAVSINPEETKKNVKVDNRSHDSNSKCAYRIQNIRTAYSK